MFSIDVCERTDPEMSATGAVGTVNGSTVWLDAGTAGAATGPSTSCSRHLDLPSVATFNCMMFLVQIVLLNLLIAIMSDSYAKVRENSRLESLHAAGLLPEAELYALENLLADAPDDGRVTALIALASRGLSDAALARQLRRKI